MTTPGPRAELLAKAIRHFAEHGVRDTSLRSLATAIGTSQRMLHYHFGSREDLMAAVIEAVAAEQATQITELFEGTDDPIEAGRRNWHRIATTATTFGPLYFELASHAMYGAPYARRLGEVLVDDHLAAFHRAYARHADNARAHSLARLTLAVGQGLLFDLLIDGDRAAADAAIEEFIAMLPLTGT